MEQTLTKQPHEDMAPITGTVVDAGPDLDRSHEPGGDKLLPIILSSLDDDQAQDVINIDLRGKTSMTDAMIICSGRSQRHVGAIADHILRKIKEAGYGRAQVEGLPHCDWVLIDIGDLIVHIFRPEVRDFYKLERMWSVELPSEETTQPTA